jgi:uncharacterized lipoprotein YehR (DUF1307 family)
MSRLNSLVLVVAFLIMMSITGCGESPDAWIRGKWVADVMGAKVEWDFRSGGELWKRALGGDLFGEVKEEEKEASRLGTWSLKENVLTITTEKEGARESIVTRTDLGFLLQPAGAPMALSFRRPE